MSQHDNWKSIFGQQQRQFDLEDPEEFIQKEVEFEQWQEKERKSIFQGEKRDDPQSLESIVYAMHEQLDHLYKLEKMPIDQNNENQSYQFLIHELKRSFVTLNSRLYASIELTENSCQQWSYYYTNAWTWMANTPFGQNSTKDISYENASTMQLNAYLRNI